MATVAENLQAVKRRIASAAARAGRETGSVSLIAVSKTQPAALIEQAIVAGQQAFGENYVQEAVAKMDQLAAMLGEPRARALEWHLIGPLQSNKTAVVAARFAWVHSVERAKIAERLSAQRQQEQPALNVLLQVNVSGEATKNGVMPAGVPALAHAVAALPRLRLRGLMAVPEPTEDEALQRARFRALRELRDALARDGLPCDTLSMGMRADMESAIAVGSTLVRIGSAIFGARQATPEKGACAWGPRGAEGARR